MQLRSLIKTLPLFLILPAFSQSNPAKPASSFGNLPLIFEPNQGQAPASVQFLTHGRGYSFSLTNGRVTVALPVAGADNSPAQLSSLVVPIELAGSSPNTKASFEEPQITHTNYFLGSDPNHWLTNIPAYGRIRYRSIYPGIDVIYYGNERHLEHDFVVAPHADPSQIILSFPESLHLSVDSATGDLLLDTGTKDASLRLLKPTTYQPGEKPTGAHTTVSSSYRLLKNNQVAFALGHYNPSRPLIIDPVLTYSTYLGGKDAHDVGGPGDIGNAIAVDASGEAYVTGTTYSTDFPVSTGSLQTTNKSSAGQPTVFVSKLNAAGTALIYSTYLGGTAGDFGYGIALDSSNNAYITGATRSTDFPVTCTAFQATKTTGALTGFVAELSANGEALTYSTYLGGSGTGSGGDISQAIALDSTGNAYVTGYTYSTDFPVTTGVLQTALAGTGTTSNAFVAKINPGGTRLLYATYLGGSGQPNTDSPFGWPPIGDYGNAIAVDSSGDAYITGSTASYDFPINALAYQSGLSGGATNAFVVELNPAATAEVFGTYLGGSGKPYNENEFDPPPAQGDSASAISLDSAGNIYVAGSTTSSDFPVTASALQGAGAFLGSSGFVTKFNKGGATLAYSTYLEGAQSSASSIAVDASGTAYIAGTAAAASISQPGGFVITAGALPAPPSSTYNSAYVVKLNPSGSRLNYATLQGGSHNDYATAIALDPAGDVFITGNATSADLPVTQGAFQTTNKNPVNPGGNAFVSRFALASETASTAYPPFPTNVPTTLTGADSGEITMECDLGSGGYSFSALVHLASAAAGPPPTGYVIFNAIASPSLSDDIYATWGTNGTDIGDYETENEDAPTSPFTLGWSAFYPGDAVYASSTVSGTAYGAGCPDNNNPFTASTKKPSTAHSSNPRGQVPQLGKNAQSASSTAASGIPAVQAAKFVPAQLTPATASSLRAAVPQAVAACIAPAITATPVLSLAPGTYTSSKTLTITDATSGAAIYYTTDGLAPTASSTPYTGAITVASTETIKAVAISAGYATSTAASATYTITSQAPVTLSPASFTFPSTAVGSTSANQTLTITNNATTPLNFITAAFSGTNASSFLATGTSCSNPLAPRSSCTVTFQFKPASSGSLSATFSLSDGAAGSPQSVALTGTATSPPAPAVSLSPSSLIFPKTPVGTTSANQILTIKNTGNAPLTFTGAAFSGANPSLFLATGTNCSNPLPAGASCTVSFAFKPTGGGYATATFALSDNAPGSPQTITLSATSITGGALILSTSSFTFPTTAVGSTSPAQTVTAKNVGTASVVITDESFSDFDGPFVLSATTCYNAVVAVGASCSVSIAFKPTATGPVTGSFSILGSYNSVPYPLTVALSGTGK